MNDADVFLCMTVNPGWGGQPFIADSPDKVGRLSEVVGDGTIEVDGGIDPGTAGGVAAAGAGLFVAGSAVFGADDPAAAYTVDRGGRGRCLDGERGELEPFLRRLAALIVLVIAIQVAGSIAYSLTENVSRLAGVPLHAGHGGDRRVGSRPRPTSRARSSRSC